MDFISLDTDSRHRRSPNESTCQFTVAVNFGVDSHYNHRSSISRYHHCRDKWSNCKCKETGFIYNSRVNDVSYACCNLSHFFFWLLLLSLNSFIAAVRTSFRRDAVVVAVVTIIYYCLLQSHSIRWAQDEEENQFKWHSPSIRYYNLRTHRNYEWMSPEVSSSTLLIRFTSINIIFLHQTTPHRAKSRRKCTFLTSVLVCAPTQTSDKLQQQRPCQQCGTLKDDGIGHAVKPQWNYVQTLIVVLFFLFYSVFCCCIFALYSTVLYRSVTTYVS